MNNRNLLNIVLLAGVIILVLTLVLDSGEKKAPKKAALTSLNADTLQHVEIKRNGLKDVVLEKTGSGWQMLSPYKTAANKFRIDTLLKLASADVESSHDLSTLKLSDYALDNPKATITFNKTIKLEFGSTNPVSRQRYVKIGNTLNLINDTQYYLARSLASEFVAMELLPKGSTISALTLPDLAILFKDGKWSVTPEPKNFTADTVSELINEWQHAQAADITEFKLRHDMRKDVSITLGESTLYFETQTSKDNFILIRHDLPLQYLFPLDFKKALLQLPKPLDAENRTPPATPAKDAVKK